MEKERRKRGETLWICLTACEGCLCSCREEERIECDHQTTQHYGCPRHLRRPLLQRRRKRNQMRIHTHIHTHARTHAHTHTDREKERGREGEREREREKIAHYRCPIKQYRIDTSPFEDFGPSIRVALYLASLAFNTPR